MADAGKIAAILTAHAMYTAQNSSFSVHFAGKILNGTDFYSLVQAN